eukprot:917635-Amphidinium_carterae.4
MSVQRFHRTGVKNFQFFVVHWLLLAVKRVGMLPAAYLLPAAWADFQGNDTVSLCLYDARKMQVTFTKCHERSFYVFKSGGTGAINVWVHGKRESRSRGSFGVPGERSASARALGEGHDCLLKLPLMQGSFGHARVHASMLQVGEAALALGCSEHDIRSCSEASHAGMFRLVRMAGRSYLQHILSLDTQPLAENEEWQLHLQGQHGYVWNRKGEARWIKDITTTFVFKNALNRMFMWKKPSVAGSHHMYEWLDEIAHKHLPKQVQFALELEGHVVASFQGKVYLWKLPRSKGFMFRELASLAKAVAVHCLDASNWMRQGLRRAWLPALFNKLGVAQDDFIAGRVGQRGQHVDSAQADFPVHQNSLSTAALLLVVRMWVLSLSEKRSRELAVALWRWFMHKAGAGTLYVSARTAETGQ